MGFHSAVLRPVAEADNRGKRPIRLQHTKVTIGRAPKNTVVLDDPEVSKFHAEIVREGETFVLRDLGSSNGTYVNGRPVSNKVLRPGDVVEFGACHYAFDEGDSDPTALKDEGTQVTILPPSPAERTQVLHASSPAALLPSDKVKELDGLRSLYDRVRAAFEAVQGLIETTDIRSLCNKILEVSFDLVRAETGAVLLFDDKHELVPWATRTTKKQDAENITMSRTIVDQVVREQKAVLASDALADRRWSSSESIVLSGVRSLMCVPLLSGSRMFGIIHVGNSSEVAAFGRNDLELLSGIGNGAGVAIANAFLAHRLAEEARSRESLGRFLSPQLVEQVVNDSIQIGRGGDEREVTVMFADIRGFTNLTERSKPTDIVAMLNEYFEQMVEVVFEQQGMLDKFIGDAIMAVWGTPVAKADDAKRAITAGRDMQRALRSLNAYREEQGKKPIYMGIGLASGACVAGAIGASRRMEYTVIGDAVNLAARLSGQAEAGQIICDAETYRRAGDTGQANQLPPMKVKGKDKPVDVFELLSDG